MIELFPAAQTDFSKLGIALHPSVCTVYQGAGGRYDANITIPYNANGEHMLPQQDMILRIPVPPHTIGPINLGTVSYYVTTASTPLYTKLGYSERVVYDTWQWSTNYTPGTMVTYNRQNYKCLTAHNSSTDGMIPGRERHVGNNVWETASNYRTVNPKTAGTLPSGTQLQKLADVNKDYALFATTSGANGYVLLSKVEATGQSTTRTVPQRNITAQLFRIDQVTMSLANRTVQLHAMHISYDMERKPLSSCVLYDATPQTALAFLQGAMLADDDRLLATDIDDTTITVDWSWLNSLNAIMAPNDGLVALTHGALIRDNADIFVLSNGEADPVYEIRYGANMQGVNWKRDTGKIYTRVYPKGKDAKGNDIFLPEGYIATSGPEPVIRTQILQVDAQVGQQIEKPDGSVVKLSEADVITLMREAATERFTKDLCDQPVVTLEVEFLFLGDTEEYKQFKGLEHLHLYDYVRVTDTPDGLDQVAQVTGYRWDALRLRYERITVGNPHDYGSASVSGYQIGTGSVSLRSLSADVISKLEGQAPTSGGSSLDELMNQVIQVATDTNGNAEAIALKVSKGDVSTELAVECGNVSITGGNLVVSGYVKASELAADIANISQVSMKSFDAPTGRVNTLDIALITGTEVSVQEVNYNEGSVGDLTVTSSLTLNGADVSEAVNSVGPATTDSATGGVSIPWTKLNGDSGTITFNVADTVYFQQAVAAAAAAVTVSGSWATNMFTATASNGQGAVGSFTVGDITLTSVNPNDGRYLTGTVPVTLVGGGSSSYTPTVNINATPSYNAGWASANSMVSIPLTGSGTTVVTKFPVSTVDTQGQVTYSLTADATPSATGKCYILTGAGVAAQLGIGAWYAAGWAAARALISTSDNKIYGPPATVDGAAEVMYTITSGVSSGSIYWQATKTARCDMTGTAYINGDAVRSSSRSQVNSLP